MHEILENISKPVILDSSVMDQYFFMALKIYNKKAVSELKGSIF